MENQTSIEIDIPKKYALQISTTSSFQDLNMAILILAVKAKKVFQEYKEVSLDEIFNDFKKLVYTRELNPD